MGRWTLFDTSSIHQVCGFVRMDDFLSAIVFLPSTTMQHFVPQCNTLAPPLRCFGCVRMDKFLFAP